MQIGLGVIGCGYWGKNYVRVFQEIPQSRVVQVSDLRPESLEVVKKHYPKVRPTTDYTDILNDPKVDAVVVATPANSHFELAKECMQAGKHVLVEKPLASNLVGGEQLVELSLKHKVTMMVGHTFLYNAGIRKVRECIQSGGIGKVYYMHATRTNMGPIRYDVNALWDLAPHDISIFNYLLDAVPESISATGARFLGTDREDVGFVTLNYPDGVVGHIHVSWINPYKVRKVTVVGSRQRIDFDDLSLTDQVRIFEKGVAVESHDVENVGSNGLHMIDGDTISPKIEPSEPLKNLCQHFLECIEDGASPLTDGQNGLDVLRVMVAIDKSMHNAHALVSLEPEREGFQLAHRFEYLEESNPI